MRAPPYAQGNNQDDVSLHVSAADIVYAPPPSACFQEYNQDDPIMQISTADNSYTSPDALTFPLVTPPQSTKDISLPLELSEDIDDSHVRGYRSTRSMSRKPRRKR